MLFPGNICRPCIGYWHRNKHKKRFSCCIVHFWNGWNSRIVSVLVEVRNDERSFQILSLSIKDPGAFPFTTITTTIPSHHHHAGPFVHFSTLCDSLWGVSTTTATEAPFSHFKDHYSPLKNYSIQQGSRGRRQRLWYPWILHQIWPTTSFHSYFSKPKIRRCRQVRSFALRTHSPHMCILLISLLSSQYLLPSSYTFCLSYPSDLRILVIILPLITILHLSIPPDITFFTVHGCKLLVNHDPRQWPLWNTTSSTPPVGNSIASMVSKKQSKSIRRLPWLSIVLCHTITS